MFMYTEKHLYECLITFEKSASEIGEKLLVFFTFFIIFFYENINQEHNLLPDSTSGTFTYICCENYMSSFSVFVLNLSKSGNILFRSIANKNYLFSSASIEIARRQLTGVCEVRVIAAIELHGNATYFAQHPALKSVYGKSQSVIVAKLFFTYRTVFELAEYSIFEIPKQVT